MFIEMTLTHHRFVCLVMKSIIEVEPSPARYITAGYRINEQFVVCREIVLVVRRASEHRCWIYHIALS